MDKRLKIAQAKELRKNIINILYESYDEYMSLETIKSLLRYKSYYTDKDMKRAFHYLQGKGKEFIFISENGDEYWDYQVKLTPLGINLAEGDIEDLGVLKDGN